MIQISNNGEPEQLEREMTLEAYLNHKAVEAGRYVVAVNQTFVPKSQYATFMLQDGHQLDILIAMQGG